MINIFTQKGGISILGILILGIMLIVTLSYFHISIKSVVESPLAKENLSYVGGVLKDVWNNYLKKPVLYIWNQIILKSLQNFTNTNSVDFNKLTPMVPSVPDQ